MVTIKLKKLFRLECLRRLRVVHRARHLVVSPVLDCPEDDLEDGAHGAVVVDGAPGARGPELQDVGDPGRLPGAGADGDPEVALTLESLVQQTALRGHAVPDNEQDQVKIN